VPVKVQPVTVTTPDTAVRLPHDDKVPAEAARVIVAVDEVTTLPNESSTLITGWVEKAAPEAPATGEVAKTRWVAVPATVVEAVAEVRPLDAAVTV
jgi:hypothetical protein